MKFTLVGTDPVALGIVAGSLAAHPDLALLGELFNRHDPVAMEASAASGCLLRFGENPMDLLRRVTAGRGNTGFTLVNDQARDDAWCRVWRFVGKETRVVRVEWDQPLRAFTERASYAYVDPVSLRDLCERLRTEGRALDRRFEGATSFRVSPERLRDMWPDLLGFLGVGVVAAPDLVLRPFEECVENHGELRDALRRTPYRIG